MNIKSSPPSFEAINTSFKKGCLSTLLTAWRTFTLILKRPLPNWRRSSVESEFPSKKRYSSGSWNFPPGLWRERNKLKTTYGAKKLLSSSHICSGTYLISARLSCGFGRSLSNTRIGKRINETKHERSGSPRNLPHSLFILTNRDKVIVVQDIGYLVCGIQDGSTHRLSDIMQHLFLIGHVRRWLEFQIAL